MKLTKADSLNLYRWLARSAALGLAVAKFRSEVFGVFLPHVRQEPVSVVPMFALHKKGILLDSVISGDHRTTWSIATAKDELTAEREGHYHAKELLRNHFNRSTGGNRGRDSNIHWGCLECNILNFMYSDMGGMVGIAAGCAERLARQWANVAHDKRPIAIAFYGEGAEQQGITHETRNAVAVSNYRWDLEKFIARYGKEFVTPLMEELGVARGAPIWIIVVRNRRSLFADSIEEYADSDLAARALGYKGMVGVHVDSDDIAKYYAECQKAISRTQECISTFMVVDTYRGSGHNYDQASYTGPINTREDLRNVQRVFGYPRDVEGTYDLSEFHEGWDCDPILYPTFILDDSRFAAQRETLAEKLTAIRLEEEARLIALAEEVLEEPEITVEEDRENRDVFPPLDPSSLPEEPVAASLLQVDPGETRVISAREAHGAGHILDSAKAVLLGQNEAYTWKVDQIMSGDSRVIYYSQDGGSKEGGVLGLTKSRRDKLSLVEKFGPSRVPNFPLSEEAGLSMVAGHSLDGPTGFWENQFGWFSADSWRVLDGTALQYYQKKMKFRFIDIFPCGRVHAGGSGDYHERYVEGYLLAMSGIVIVFASNAYDLVGLLHTANLYDGPVAIILEISAANSTEFAHLARNWATGEVDLSVPQGVPFEPYAIPFGKAKIVRKGKDFTVVAYGACALAGAKNTADFQAKEEGIDTEVIDPRTLRPMDFETIEKSVEKTGRLAIMQSANEFRGVGHYIISQLVRKGGALSSILTGEIELVCAGMEGDLFVPTAKPLLEARSAWYTTEVPAFDMESGIDYSQRIHRSDKLAQVIRNGMRYR